MPVGGGGLASGIAIALQSLRPDVSIVGVRAREHAGEASGRRSLTGSRSRTLGSLASSVLGERLDDMVEVSDEEIAQAIVLCLERTKLVVEGAGAVGVAALLAGRIDGDGPTCVVLSGGNIDATTLISVMRHGLTLAGRYLVVRTRVPDRPGELRKLLDARRRGARERRRRRAPAARERIIAVGETGDLAHARHAGRGALRDAARDDARLGLRGRAVPTAPAVAQVPQRRNSTSWLPCARHASRPPWSTGRARALPPQGRSLRHPHGRRSRRS